MKRDEATIGDTPEAIAERQALLDEMVAGDSHDMEEIFYSEEEDGRGDSQEEENELNEMST